MTCYETSARNKPTYHKDSAMKIIMDKNVTITTERATVQGQGANRTEQLRDAFAQLSRRVLCPVCGVSETGEGYICADCSADIRR